MRIGNMTLSTSASGLPQYVYKGSTGLQVGEFDMDHGDKWSLIPVKTPRSVPKVKLTVGRDILEVKCSRQQLTALLLGSSVVRGQRVNKFYEVPRKTLGELRTLDEQKLGAFWLTSGVQILVEGTKVWLAEDPATEISTYMPKVLAQRLRAAARKGSNPPPVHEPKLVEASTNDVWALIVPSTQHVGSYWVAGSVARAELQVLAKQFLNQRFAHEDIPSTLSVYRINGKAPVAQRISKTPLMLTKVMDAAKFVRTLRIKQDRVPVDSGGKDLAQIGDHYSRVSWSAYNPVDCYAALHGLCSQGFFTDLHTVAKTKGIVLEYGQLDAASGKEAAVGWAKRIYSWVYGKLGKAPKINLQCGTARAALSFDWPALTSVQRESIRMLRDSPPTLRAPMYAEKGAESRGLCIQTCDYNTGVCMCSPTRAASVAQWEPIPYANLVEWKGA